MNELLKELISRDDGAYRTANGAAAYASTMDAVYDLFALGGAMRSSSEENCILLFAKAYDENPTLALKCLFYLRDVRDGQGERRFFRLAMHWLAQKHPEETAALVAQISEFGRADDIYALMDTPAEAVMYQYIHRQLLADEAAERPSLLAKWLPSPNTSSAKTRALAKRTYQALHLTERDYRKTLSILRNRINVLERLMSANEWDKIKFDSIPSRAGLLYREAFKRHDMQRYEKFIKDERTTVNAGALYPYDVVKQVTDTLGKGWCRRQELPLNSTSRLTMNKYWDNLTDYFNSSPLNALVVCDTSGSMTMAADGNIAPMDVAISLALYSAERAQGPFHNYFISFSRRPKLIKTEGVDFYDKVHRIYDQNLCENTNIEATFDLVLDIAIKKHLKQEELPESIVIISDMQFDQATYGDEPPMEAIERRWNEAGYKMPKLVFWNVNASLSKGNIPMEDRDGITFVSGASPVIYEMVMTNKTGRECMFDKLLSDRYSSIVSIQDQSGK